jgi:diguanylate cyclase
MSETDRVEKPIILICDDDNMTLMLARQCLESEGMRVIEATNGPATIDLFVREAPDLIVLDVNMPGMSGLEVCERIRRMPQGSEVPIMLVTGADDADSIDSGFKAGATQYKTKPVNWSLLGRDVKFMLRAASHFQALKQQEDRLRYLAYYDPLTSLPNRRSFTTA